MKLKPPTSNEPARSWRQWLLLALGVVVVLFVVRRLESSWSDAVDVLGSAQLSGTLLAGVSALLAMTAIALGWEPLLRAAEHVAPTRQIIGWYFVGEVTKYLPGGIWSVVGRGEFAADQIGRPAAYRAVTQSLIAFFAIGSLPAALAVGTYDAWNIGLRAVAALALLSAFPLTVRLLGIPSSVILTLCIRFGAAWLMVGLTTMLVAGSLDLSMRPIDAVTVTAAAWVAGFVVVFVPGGIGVREASFVALAPETLSAGEALAIAALCRLLFVAADSVGAILGLLDRHGRRGLGAS